MSFYSKLLSVFFIYCGCFGLVYTSTNTNLPETCKNNLRKLAYAILKEEINKADVENGKEEELSNRAARLFIENEILKLKLNQTSDTLNKLQQECATQNSNLERCESRVTTLTNSIGSILDSLPSESNRRCESGQGMFTNQVLTDDKRFSSWFTNNLAKFNETPKDCVEILLSGWKESGVYNIYLDGQSSKPTRVYCDMSTDGGGWTTILQRGKRGTVREDFYKNLVTYEQGFGDVEGGDFIIGLMHLHTFTSARDQELRVDLFDWEGGTAYANYKFFWVGDTNEKYKLMIGGFSGNAGDAMSTHNGHYFSTHDHDNDIDSSNCAVVYNGAWWFKNCHTAHLNGKYSNVSKVSAYAQGLIWKPWKEYHYSLKSAEMKIRSVNFALLRQIFA